ncbi:MAG: TrkA family potassium uptake protein, partial [Micromonosporaceae bacterium]|nr:TrkA family potassium uptake protein [Micromonosporaceae bacterium]
NNPANEWLFDDAWGVDAAVSTPRMLAAMVEEATGLGDLVRLMTFRQGEANLVEITLPSTAPHVGLALRQVPLPRDSALVAIVRGKRVLVPTPDDTLEAGDELVFVCTAEMEDEVRTVVLGADPSRGPGGRAG